MKLTKNAKKWKDKIVESMRKNHVYSEGYIKKYMQDNDPYVIATMNDITKGQ